MIQADDTRRVLVAIPAYNEVATIGDVISAVRVAAPHFDLLVVNDGSRDATEVVLGRMGVRVATHYCNIGYARALQTALRYAHRHGYEAVITFDADGQHRPMDIVRLWEAFSQGAYDLLIGSRFVEPHKCGSNPFARRVGMVMFSTIVRCLTGQRVYDTSSGLRVIGRRVFSVLTDRPMVDFHAEALVYLIRAGYRVGEHPVSVNARQHGESMYKPMAALAYPLKVLFLAFLSALEARQVRPLP